MATIEQSPANPLDQTHFTPMRLPLYRGQSQKAVLVTVGLQLSLATDLHYQQ